MEFGNERAWEIFLPYSWRGEEICLWILLLTDGQQLWFHSFYGVL